MKYDEGEQWCYECGKALNPIEKLIDSIKCFDCTSGAQHSPTEMAAYQQLVVHERQRQIEGWLLGPPTSAAERARAQRIEELLAA